MALTPGTALGARCLVFAPGLVFSGVGVFGVGVWAPYGLPGV